MEKEGIKDDGGRKIMEEGREGDNGREQDSRQWRKGHERRKRVWKMMEGGR